MGYMVMARRVKVLDHASVGGPLPAAEEAGFIIHTAAAVIRYVIKTYG